MKKELLVVSFGTSYQESREKTIGAIEKTIERAYGEEYDIKRAFTSRMIIEKLKKRDGISIQNVTEALNEAKQNGVKTLLVQPTHLLRGHEYQEVKDIVGRYQNDFESILIGRPLLDSEDDFEMLIEALVTEMLPYERKDTAICFMGHGTDAVANEAYEKLQRYFLNKGKENYFIATVEAEPSFEEVVKKVVGKGYKHAVLQPLMIVAGDHANNDMAGDEEDSWKSLFEAQGISVECILKGLGEIRAIQEIFVKHVAENIR